MFGVWRHDNIIFKSICPFPTIDGSGDKKNMGAGLDFDPTFVSDIFCRSYKGTIFFVYSFFFLPCM